MEASLSLGTSSARSPVVAVGAVGTVGAVGAGVAHGYIRTHSTRDARIPHSTCDARIPHDARIPRDARSCRIVGRTRLRACGRIGIRSNRSAFCSNIDGGRPCDSLPKTSASPSSNCTSA